MFPGRKITQLLKLGPKYHLFFYPFFFTQVMKEFQLCFTFVSTLTPNLQVLWQQTTLNILNIHFHHYHNVREKLLLKHVLHLIQVNRKALQNKTCRPRT